MRIKSASIKEFARTVGFDLCGIARVRSLEEWRVRYEGWLKLEMDGGLEYLKRNVDKRFSPGLLIENAASVLVCAVVYKNDTSLLAAETITDGYGTPIPKIASYARTTDYHTTMKRMLFDLAGKLTEKYGRFGFRAFTDSAPVAEKPWAVEAGLGGIGRNSLLINPRLGSFLLLGELVVSVEVDEYDKPVGVSVCGNCRRCVDACPNGAIGERGVDLRKCISRKTTSKERKSEDGRILLKDDAPLHGWIYGCDICQSVCPYNFKSPFFTNPLFSPLFSPLDYPAERWQSMDKDEFTRTFGSTPLASNSSLERLKRYLSES